MVHKSSCRKQLSLHSMNEQQVNTTLPSEDLEEEWTNEDWMIPYLFFLLLIGTFGNACSLLLFAHSSMRKYSCSLYFALLAVFDELTLFIWITNRLSGEIGDIQLRNRSTILCKLFVVGYYSASQISIGMLVLAMFDRLYTSYKIAHGHFDARLPVQRRHFQHVCLGVFFFFITTMNAILFGSQLVAFSDDDGRYCVIINPNITHIYAILDLCVYAIVPCSCMLIGDTLILYYINKTRARVTSTNHANRRHERQLSIMLIITSIVSLFIISPYSFLNLLINFSNILKDDYRTLDLLNDVFGLLSTFTHAIHFYLFLMISSTIRKHFKTILQSLIKNCSKPNNVIQPALLPTINTTTSSPPTLNLIHHS